LPSVNDFAPNLFRRRTSHADGSEEQWADELCLDQAVELLEETLQEKKTTDEALTGLAQSAVNQEAQQAE
jgi:ferritin-like metal-binding protein YciE